MSDSSYDIWHRNLGHSEYRVKITMQGYGSDEGAAELFLNGFLETHPDLGPVISQNSKEDTIAVTLLVQAGGEDRAVTLAGDAWADGGIRSGLEPGDVVRMQVERVAADDDHEDAETQDPVYA